MPNFVEHIIETDKQARIVIEQAHKNRAQLLQQAKAEADSLIAEHKAKLDAQLAELEKGITSQEETQLQRAHDEYIEVKHELDEQFNAKYDLWLKDIIAKITKQA